MSDIPERIHKRLIETIVSGLSDKPLLLKGGTALMLAYKLDRYSEDIDYDSNTRINLAGELDDIMRETRMTYKIVTRKHTPTTSRVFIKYTTERIQETNLCVEIKNNIKIPVSDINQSHSFQVYCINRICREKIRTTSERTKPRDLYDLGFIASNFKAELDDKNLLALENLFLQKKLIAHYKEFWSMDDMVKHKPFLITVASLSTITKYLQARRTDAPLKDFER